MKSISFLDISLHLRVDKGHRMFDLKSLHANFFKFSCYDANDSVFEFDHQDYFI